MLVFIYESQTAGGWQHWSEPPQASLLREGRAMIAALATDFAQLPGVDVLLLRHEQIRLPPLPDNVRTESVVSLDEHNNQFARAAAGADWSIVIAPGIELILRATDVQEAGGRLLSPSPAIVVRASDKNATADDLRRHGVPVSQGQLLMHPLREEDVAPFAEFGLDGHLRELAQAIPEDFPFPAVLKPSFGAGSQGIHYLPTRDSLPAIDCPCRLERFHPGEAVSVAALCGPVGHVLLPACRQHLSSDGRFTYLGGSLPLAPALARRACNLAARAIATLDEPLGYVGVDLVLGEAPDGSTDVVIEINPRLTTSYIGLRAACRNNLAAAMLDVAEGRPCKLSWRDELVEFDPDGTVRIGKSANLTYTQDET